MLNFVYISSKADREGCARGTRRRPCPTHRIFGACYWSLPLTSPAVLSLR